MVWPFSSISPASGGTSPARHFSRVVLPDPEAPKRTVMPGGMSALAFNSNVGESVLRMAKRSELEEVLSWPQRLKPLLSFFMAAGLKPYSTQVRIPRR